VTTKVRHLAFGAAVVIPVIAIFLLVEPYPQPATYFSFADQRTVFGVPHFWNVVSNLPFLVFGVLGLLRLKQDRLSIIEALRPAYWVFFTGISLTALGSAWFHLAPDNATLFWDRLPMTIAFMSLFAVIVGEHVSESLGIRLLWPLILIGATSVLYWAWTEQRGAGDLRLYGIVQFLPMLLIPMILILYPSRFDRAGFLWLVFIVYALAKLSEHLDAQLLATGNMLSGHSLKHVIASLAPVIVIRGMGRRKAL
jgi:hypothetical protein